MVAFSISKHRLCNIKNGSEIYTKQKKLTINMETNTVFKLNL
jgi:hypothetical protein